MKGTYDSRGSELINRVRVGLLFFEKKPQTFGGHKSFCGATGTPVLVYGDICLDFKVRMNPSLYALSPAYNGFLRFTSGVLPANTLMTSIAA